MFKKVVNRNWKAASTIVVEPLFRAIIGSMVQPKLKYFSGMPVNKIFIDDIAKYMEEAIIKGLYNIIMFFRKSQQDSIIKAVHCLSLKPANFITK